MQAYSNIIGSNASPTGELVDTGKTWSVKMSDGTLVDTGKKKKNLAGNFINEISGMKPTPAPTPDPPQI